MSWMSSRPTKEHRQRYRELRKLEPRLKEIEKQIRSIDSSSLHFCANCAWFDGIFQQILPLVGWHAENPELSTCFDYDSAYLVLYNMLPDCKDCGCL